VGLLAVGVAGAIFRPRGIAAWIIPLIAAVLAVVTTVLDLSQVHDALRPLASPLGFVLVAVPLAVSLDRVGVFHELAAIAARRRFVVGWLWILAALVVAFLNLDAAVVLLTPLYIRTAALIDVDPIALAFQPVLLASLASGVLAVSNLTNLLAASHLSLTNVDFLRHLALPSVVASVVAWIGYRVLFHSQVRVRALPPAHDSDRRALVLGLGAIALFLLLLVGGEHVGVEAWQAALITEVLLIVVTRAVPVRALPIGTVVLAGALAVLAAGVELRLPHAFDQLGRGGAHGFLAGVVSANVINNLPATLVGLPHIARVDAVWAMLLGVNMGPVLVLTGSLAGLLWQEGARRAGCSVRATTYMRVGAIVGIPAMVGAYITLAVTGVK
jgi:arsenical pump membrane protein